MQAENVVKKRDNQGSKKLRQKSSILPPENGVKIVNENDFQMHRQRRHRQ
jgi:hypothetical protein